MHRPLYNQLVPYYEFIEGRDWQGEIKLITFLLRNHKSRSVVDLGCGTGYHVRALAKLGFDATGIDISKQNLRFARRKAQQDKVHTRFVLGSYYAYRPDGFFDAALCLNWSIPVKDDEVKRFLDNTYSLLRPEGLLIFDYERASQIVWGDVGKAITESWDLGGKLIVRVSVGNVVSNVLCSSDVYIIYSKSKPMVPSETSRYQPPKATHVETYVDSSYVRFFSVSEIRDFAEQSGFKMIADFMMPRKKYRRHYAVLMKTA